MPKRSSSSVLASPKKKKALEATSSSSPVAGKVQSKGRKVIVEENDEDVDENNLDAREERAMDEEEEEEEIKLVKKDPEAQVLKNAFFEFFASVTQKEVKENPAQVVKKARSLASRLPEVEVAERKAVIDQLMRDYLVERTLHAKCSWKDFLELGILLAKEEVCSSPVLFTLISDFFELGSLRECHEIFGFVESHIDVWKLPSFMNHGKNAVLRMCNDLLRRLSRAQNTIFCGRILIFLSNYLPFAERSGLNIMSEFSQDNFTVYKSGSGEDGDDDPEDKMDIVGEGEDEKNEVLFEGIDISIPGLDKIIEETKEEKKNKMKVDYNLYVKFWSLQDYFRKPFDCYNKVHWKHFSMYINDVLTVFSFFKIDDGGGGSTSKNNNNKKLKKRRSIGQPDSFSVAVGGGTGSSSAVDLGTALIDIPRLSDESHYFAKYLTNRRLLELQLNDPSFRRYFLIQLLVVLQFLTVNVKFKGEVHVLNEEQQEFVRKTTDRVYQLMEETPPAGKEFVEAVKHVLAREQLWNQWKNDGCPAFTKPTVNNAIVTDSSRLDNKDDSKLLDGDNKGKLKAKLDSDDFEIEPVGKTKKKRRRHLGSIIADATENGRFLMGNSELTRLWNICGDNLEACRSKARDFTPPIETFFAEAFKEVETDPVPPDPKKEVVQPKEILGNSNFGWRALRLLARKSPYFFQMFGGAPVHPLQNYLEFVLRKILAEKEVPAQPSTPDSLEKSQVSKEENPSNEDGDDGTDRKRTTQEEEQEAEMMEGEAEEDEEMMNEAARNESEEDEEEGEVNDKVRNLTDVEIKALGKQLTATWKKLALKLGFSTDEVQYFEDETAKEPETVGAYMLQRWTEQEGEEATVADLLYTLEGLGLTQVADGIF